jgi:predicted lipoprotein with Yx(FWY)xxD motif
MWELKFVSSVAVGPLQLTVSEEDREMRQIKLVAAMLIVLFASYAYAADKMPAGVQVGKSDAGKMILADAKGMTLYTFDKDADGKSNCAGRCLMNWPALVAEANAANMGDWTVVTRDDGSKQWAYKGKPLYTFVKDMKPGDTTGDNVGMVWHVALP